MEPTIKHSVYLKLFRVKRNVLIGPYSGKPYRAPVGVWSNPIIGPLRVCVNGWHAMRSKDLRKWAPGPPDDYYTLFLVEVKRAHSAHNKVVGRQIRLLRIVDAAQTRNARLAKPVEEYSPRESMLQVIRYADPALMDALRRIHLKVK